jgi:hypothetical protein
LSGTTKTGAIRVWIRRAAAATGLGAFAYIIATWLFEHRRLLGMGIPTRHPDYGHFMQSMGQGLVPFIAGIALACAALVPSRASRTIATAGAVALVVTLYLLLIRGSGQLVFEVTLALAPALLYVTVARRPAWWIVPVLAAAPLLFVLASLDYEVTYYMR